VKNTTDLLITNDSMGLSVTMPSVEKVDTHRKALTLNLDPSTFGSFAEIGAGQEVARWFLVVVGRHPAILTVERRLMPCSTTWNR